MTRKRYCTIRDLILRARAALTWQTATLQRDPWFLRKFANPMASCWCLAGSMQAVAEAGNKAIIHSRGHANQFARHIATYLCRTQIKSVLLGLKKKWPIRDQRPVSRELTTSLSRYLVPFSPSRRCQHENSTRYSRRVESCLCPCPGPSAAPPNRRLPAAWQP